MGNWSEGRPVFKKVDGEQKFLSVIEGWSNWRIQPFQTGTAAHIVSGRATNSPSSPEAGPSVREGMTRWRYWDGSSHVEGDISVTCLHVLIR